MKRKHDVMEQEEDEENNEEGKARKTEVGGRNTVKETEVNRAKGEEGRKKHGKRERKKD